MLDRAAARRGVSGAHLSHPPALSVTPVSPLMQLPPASRRPRALHRFAATLTLVVSSAGLAAARPEAFHVAPETTDQLPRGKEADGIIGDIVLRNDRIEAVISGNMPLRRANMSTFYGATGITPGCLYDLTLRGTHNDQITIFSPGGQQGMISHVRIVKDGTDGESVVETYVAAALNGGLAKRHEYTLRDGWSGILVTTTVHNESSRSQKVSTDDRWTNFATSGTFADILWADAVDPADKAGYAQGLVTGPAQRGTRELQAGATLTFSRFLAVGTSPAEALGHVAAHRGPTGLVAGQLRETGSAAPIRTAAISLRPAAGATVRTLAYPDAAGRFSFRLPPDDYVAEISDLGRTSVARPLRVTADATSALDVTLPPAATVRFDITDDLGRSPPCKVQFHGVDGTKNPHLGPQNRAAGCIDQYHSAKGRFAVALPPGKYRIVVTRGIEYSHLARTVEVGAAQTVDFAGTLRRLVDTTGWVSADYHSHSTPSGDNTCATDDRIVNLAAEHIEFAPTTEHNRLYDWRPHIEKLGLGDYLRTVPGLELTGSGAHQNSFPFQPEPFRQDNGAPVWNADPRITAITLRDWQGAEPDRWVQINHPDMVANFTDRDGDGAVDGGFRGLAELIDALEVQNYQPSSLLLGRPFSVVKSGGRDTVAYHREFIWLQMLNRGHRYAGVAVSDAHSVYGNGVGSWRMYLPSRSDLPAEIDWRENSRHAKSGRSILTSGPFLQVRTDDGTLPGGTLRATSPVKLHVKVQCTDWIDIDRVQVLVNGQPRRELNFTRATHPDWFGSGVVKFERTLEIPLTQDSHLIVVAAGENSDLSIGFGTSPQARVKPVAFHNPIFVDLDGGGFTPNGDLLGWPLPVKKLSVEDARRLTAAR